jgi:hypothetical protein
MWGRLSADGGDDELLALSGGDVDVTGCVFVRHHVPKGWSGCSWLAGQGRGDGGERLQGVPQVELASVPHGLGLRILPQQG